MQTSTDTTWIVIVHHRGALVFERVTAGEVPTRIEALDCHHGTAYRGELGEEFVDGEVTDTFLSHLADELDEAREARRFARVLLVAPVDLSAQLFARVSPVTRTLIARSFAKDFTAAPEDAVRDEIWELMYA
jgi:hypothetical protein